eukprot:5521974-Alexandrium_andersonii.AAC.1
MWVLDRRPDRPPARDGGGGRPRAGAARRRHGGREVPGGWRSPQRLGPGAGAVLGGRPADAARPPPGRRGRLRDAGAE